MANKQNKRKRGNYMEESKNYFVELNNINVNDKTEKKNGLTYLSWAWAWGEAKKLHPTATYTIYETTNPEGYVCNYFTDGKTAWVKTGVTIDGIELIEYLPVMDFKNNSIPLERITSFDANKAIQRSLTKCCARHGLGLAVYAGEDLPLEEVEAQLEEVEAQPVLKQDVQKATVAPKKAIKSNTPVCATCGKAIEAGNGMTVEQVADAVMKKYGAVLCNTCRAKRKGLSEKAVAVVEKMTDPVEIPVDVDEEVELPFEIGG